LCKNPFESICLCLLWSLIEIYEIENFVHGLVPYWKAMLVLIGAFILAAISKSDQLLIDTTLLLNQHLSMPGKNLASSQETILCYYNHNN
jgi:hypothetical protein